MGRGLFQDADDEFVQLEPEELLKEAVSQGRGLGTSEFRLEPTEQRAILTRGLGLPSFD